MSHAAACVHAVTMWEIGKKKKKAGLLYLALTVRAC